MPHDLWAALLGAGGVGGLWTLMAVRTKARGDVAVAHVAAAPDLVTAAAAFQQAMTKEAERITADLRGRIEALEVQNGALQAQCEAALARCAASDDAHAQCRAEVAALRVELERRAFSPPVPAYVLPASAAPKD